MGHPHPHKSAADERNDAAAAALAISVWVGVGSGLMALLAGAEVGFWKVLLGTTGGLTTLFYLQHLYYVLTEEK